MKTILIKFHGEALGMAELQSILSQAALLVQMPEVSIAIYHALDSAQTYAYVQICAHDDNTGHDSDLNEVCLALRRVLTSMHPSAEVVPLQCTLDVAGSSSGKEPAWHYVVETDVLAQAEDDFNDWYSTEHLPGLAAVPGTIRARRYLCTDSSPRHYATYDLETKETFGSEPWLAVRASAWSSRVRPNFINTARTLFKKAPGSF